MKKETLEEMGDGEKPFVLHLGDCIDVMRTMADNSVDAIVTDPPYELGFMGKSWDASGIAYNVEMWRQSLRVLKPGGHLLAFSGSRTYHRMAVAIEDAGFDIRDQIMWVYGSGFPKSLDVSKAIDKAAGAERVGTGEIVRAGCRAARGGTELVGSESIEAAKWKEVTLPATDAAHQWEGWGTSLKPAHEPICVARKPLIGTVAANVLQFGTGALNIDACRVQPTGESRSREHEVADERVVEGATSIAATAGAFRGGDPMGRWPANLIHDGSDEVVALFPREAGGSAPVRGTEASAASVGRVTGERARVAGAFHADSGSAARFFYCAKASRADRNEGVGSSDAPAVANGATMRQREDANWSARNGNHHPTVKPTDLMAYLVRLVTPPGGVVYDPFMGSGSTGKACMREGFRFIGSDITPDYLPIAQARIEYERRKVLVAQEAAAASAAAPQQFDLFAAEG